MGLVLKALALRCAGGAGLGTSGISKMLLGSTTATPAYAQCSPAAQAGDWHNIDSNTRSATRAVITFECGDQRLCDTNGHCTGGRSLYRAHLFGKCHPLDRDWGTVTTTDLGRGWQMGTYRFGFKTSFVWLTTASFGGVTY
jgi:hypothetical protein